jgi:predicted nucleotidyltransferase
MKREKLTDKKILNKLEKKKEELKRYGVKKIGIFGSFVRGQQNKKSDIDILVEFDLDRFGKNFKGLYETYIELSEYLEKLFGRKVDILTPISIETIRVKEVAEEIKKSVRYV